MAVGRKSDCASTASAREIIRGLTSGADDYVVKPFMPDVLLARARAVLRRARHTADGTESVVFSDGYLTIDLEERYVCVRDVPVKLSAKEFRLLALFARRPSRALAGWPGRFSVGVRPPPIVSQASRPQCA